MAGVNDLGIKVGQVWRTRGGGVVTVDLHDSADSTYPWRTTTGDRSAIWVTNSGREYPALESNNDLIELVKDEETLSALGWTSDGKKVEYRYERGPGRTDIYAYKVVEEAAQAAQADSATLAEETLSALGWTFDGQAWVEQPKVELLIGMVEGDDREYTGGSVSYYKVPVKHPTSGGEPYDAECNDLIETLGMNFAEGNAFKAIWRLCAARRGLSKRGYDEGVYDAEKVVFFGQRMVVQQKEGGA